MEHRQTISVLVVSRPGLQRQSLRAVLAGFPWIRIVGETGDALNALGLVALRQPDLLVIDANLLDEEVQALLAATKARHPHPGCLVVRYSHQQERELLAAGADAVILRDSSAEELERMLIKVSQAA